MEITVPVNLYNWHYNGFDEPDYDVEQFNATYTERLQRALQKQFPGAEITVKVSMDQADGWHITNQITSDDEIDDAAIDNINWLINSTLRTQ